MQELLTLLEDGNYLETAAELTGIAENTVRNWMKRGEAGEKPFDLFMRAAKRASAKAEAVEVGKVREAGKDPRFWAASMTYLERRHPERWARRSEDSNSPKVIVQIGARESDVQVTLISSPQGNHNGPYQTQTIGESQSTQLLTAPYLSANEAKAGGESE